MNELRVPRRSSNLLNLGEGGADDTEWLTWKLTEVTKYRFLELVRSRSLKGIKEITGSLNIQIPLDLNFSTMDVKLCKSRWIMELLVLISMTLIFMQWFQFTIVSDTMVTFYNTSPVFINWTSLIYMLCYVLFTFPVSYVLDNRIVVRWTVLIKPSVNYLIRKSSFRISVGR